MHLRDFYTNGLEYSLAQVAGDGDLTEDIQTTLMWVGLLETSDKKPDRSFGPITTDAFDDFQKLTKCPKIGTFDNATAKALIETSPDQIKQLVESTPLRPGNDLAGRIIKYMISNGYSISQQLGTYNIVYIEGIDPDGTLNDDRINYFNDLRTVIQIDIGVPKIVGKWIATTEPGTFYTDNPENKKGAARIQFGQYKAWAVGRHKQQNLALRQEANVTVCRDFNKDGARTNDNLDTGNYFGINQHHADDQSRTDIGLWSAGCLVGMSKDEHNDFMEIVMKDRRYKLNSNYLFETTIIAGDDLNLMFPI
jgi:hypothetical protein